MAINFVSLYSKEQGNVESGRQKLERMYNEYVSEMIAKGYDKTSPEIIS